jgi:hypothetical protein
MDLLHTLVPRFFSILLSWIGSGNLRNRLYTLEQRVEILETALGDIERINSKNAGDPLVQGIVDRVNRVEKASEDLKSGV